MPNLTNLFFFVKFFNCAFIRMAGIVRGSVGGACINNSLTLIRFLWLFFEKKGQLNQQITRLLRFHVGANLPEDKKKK